MMFYQQNKKINKINNLRWNILRNTLNEFSVLMHKKCIEFILFYVNNNKFFKENVE